MQKLRILITGCGAPGTAGTIYSLRNNWDNRKVEIIGTDINPNNAGRYLCDEFYPIRRATNPFYLTDIVELTATKYIDLVLPQNTDELRELSDYGIHIIISSFKSISKANTKQGEIVEDLYTLKQSILKLGWPKKKVVIKPPDSHGMRGVRIIDESFNEKESFYNDKPGNIHLTFDRLKSVLGYTFSPLIVQEYYPGKEYSVDCFRFGNRFEAIPRERMEIKNGITWAGKIIKNDYLIKECKRLAKEMDLKYCFGFQFKEDSEGIPRLLECNPRVQGSMVCSTLAGANIIYASVKALLGEEIPKFKINWGLEFYRYWGGITNKNIRI